MILIYLNHCKIPPKRLCRFSEKQLGAVLRLTLDNENLKQKMLREYKYWLIVKVSFFDDQHHQLTGGECAKKVPQQPVPTLSKYSPSGLTLLLETYERYSGFYFFLKMPHSFLHHPVEDLDEKTKPPLFLSWRTRRLRSSFSPTAVKTTHHHHSSLARRRAPVDHDEHCWLDRHVTVNATVNGRHSTGIDSNFSHASSR